MTRWRLLSPPPAPEQIAYIPEGVARRAVSADELTGADDLIFRAVGGGHLDDMAVRQAFERHLKAAGLKRVRFHDLRHTFGSQAVKVLPVTDVQAILGHAHVRTTLRYVHYKPGHDESAKLAGGLRQRRRSVRGPEHGPQQGRFGGRLT